jgi:hypothetical protein
VRHTARRALWRRKRGGARGRLIVAAALVSAALAGPSVARAFPAPLVNQAVRAATDKMTATELTGAVRPNASWSSPARAKASWNLRFWMTGRGAVLLGNASSDDSGEG